MSKDNLLRVGDPVIWKGGFSLESAQVARVSALEVTRSPFQKHGHSVQEAAWTLVQENRVVVSLDNGHWAYGHQVSPMVHQFTPAERRAVLAGLRMLWVYVQGENQGGFDLEQLSAAAAIYWDGVTGEDDCNLEALIGELHATLPQPQNAGVV